MRRPSSPFPLSAVLKSYELPQCQLLAAYYQAIQQNYRFYSFGDAMLIL